MPLLFVLLGCALWPLAARKQEVSLDLIQNHTNAATGERAFIFRVLDSNNVIVGNVTEFSYYENDELISEYESLLKLERFYTPYKTGIMLLDVSGSMVGSQSLEKMREAARQFVNAKHRDTELAIFTFDCVRDIRANVVITFTRSSADLLTAIEGLNETHACDCSTNVYGAVENAINILRQRVGVDDSIAQVVIFSDCKHRAGTGAPGYPTLAELHNRMSTSKYAFFAVGIGPELDPDTLKAIGRDGHAIVEKKVDLEAIFRDWAMYNQFYKVTYCSPARTSEHTLTIRVESPDFTGKREFPFTATENFARCREAVAPQN